MSSKNKSIKSFLRERHGHEEAIKKYVTPLEKTEKENKVEMDKKEFIKEHKKLVQVLESESHKDDKKEAKKQKKEMQEYAKKAYKARNSYPKTMDCGSGLSGKICNRNQRKLNKSIDFQDANTAIESIDHYVAEKTVPAQLMEYLNTAKELDLVKLPFENGSVLIINKIQRGLYKATFQDQYGDTLENFDPQTLEMLAKNLIIKQLYSPPINHDEQDEKEDREIARDEVEEALERHNALYHKGQTPGESINARGSVRVKYGNFELEIKKSIHNFVKSFKESKVVDKNTIAKAVKAWRRNHLSSINSDSKAAYELLNNWDQHKESFFQTVHAMRYLVKGD